MSNPSPKNLSASVHQRLLNMARETARPFNDLLQYYAMERFLYRLSQSPDGGKFILKGALMLMVWKAPDLRPTMDIDLLGRIKNDVDAICRIMQMTCDIAVEPDGMAFDAASVSGERITEDAEYEGVRIFVKGHLGKARVAIQIDIGFGDAISPKAATIEYPTMLSYPSPRLKGYSRQSAVAEKFHAMIRHDMLNSRMKDFYDIWLLAQKFDFDGKSLGDAIRRTFACRQTDIPSNQIVAFSERFYRDLAKAGLWASFIRKTKLAHAPRSFEQVVLSIAAFLTPLTISLAKGKPFNKNWPPGGPWQD